MRGPTVVSLEVDQRPRSAVFTSTPLGKPRCVVLPVALPRHRAHRDTAPRMRQRLARVDERSQRGPAHTSRQLEHRSGFVHCGARGPAEKNVQRGLTCVCG